jgi:hypothetical protein
LQAFDGFGELLAGNHAARGAVLVQDFEQLAGGRSEHHDLPGGARVEFDQHARLSLQMGFNACPLSSLLRLKNNSRAEQGLRSLSECLWSRRVHCGHEYNSSLNGRATLGRCAPCVCCVTAFPERAPMIELERLLRSQGFGSRADCRALIRSGSVSVAGQPCD